MLALSSHTWANQNPEIRKEPLAKDQSGLLTAFTCLFPQIPKVLILTFGGANRGAEATPGEKSFAPLLGKDLVLAIKKQFEFSNFRSQS